MLSTAAPLDSNAIKAQIYVWVASLANCRRAGISASAEPPVLCSQLLLSCCSLPSLLPPFQNLCHGIVSWTLKCKDFFKAISLEFLKLWSRLSHVLETKQTDLPFIAAEKFPSINIACLSRRTAPVFTHWHSLTLRTTTAFLQCPHHTESKESTSAASTPCGSFSQIRDLSGYLLCSFFIMHVCSLYTAFTLLVGGWKPMHRSVPGDFHWPQETFGEKHSMICSANWLPKILFTSFGNTLQLNSPGKNVQ